MAVSFILVILGRGDILVVGAWTQHVHLTIIPIVLLQSLHYLHSTSVCFGIFTTLTVAHVVNAIQFHVGGWYLRKHAVPWFSCSDIYDASPTIACTIQIQSACRTTSTNKNNIAMMWWRRGALQVDTHKTVVWCCGAPRTKNSTPCHDCIVRTFFPRITTHRLYLCCSKVGLGYSSVWSCTWCKMSKHNNKPCCVFYLQCPYRLLCLCLVFSAAAHYQQQSTTTTSRRPVSFSSVFALWAHLHVLQSINRFFGERMRNANLFYYLWLDWAIKSTAFFSCSVCGSSFSNGSVKSLATGPLKHPFPKDAIELSLARSIRLAESFPKLPSSPFSLAWIKSYTRIALNTHFPRSWLRYVCFNETSTLRRFEWYHPHFKRTITCRIARKTWVKSALEFNTDNYIYDMYLRHNRPRNLFSCAKRC